ncbi:hypothetical protein IIY68_00460 [Candidatus Saccharibacteria bacterium]|nr:hypothetical protein [Candidatus Saccharibacteria bacterium]
MKKKLIVGASAVTLAAMPVVGVFAAPSAPVMSQTDTLMITIDQACSIGYDSDTSGSSSTIEVTGVAHDDTGMDGDWGTDSTAAAGTVDHPDTLSATMVSGTSSNALGTTTLGIYCNNENGYQITADTAPTAGESGSLTSSTVAATIPLLASFGDGSGGTATGWSFKVARGTAATQRGVIKNGHNNWSGDNAATSGPKLGEAIAGSDGISGNPQTTTNSGDFFTITYGAGIDQTTPAATYTGSIKYTLAAL